MSIQEIQAALVGVPNTRTVFEHCASSSKPVVCSFGQYCVSTEVQYTTTKEAWAKYYAAVHPVAVKDLIHDLTAARERIEELEKRLDIGPHGEDRIDVQESAYAQLTRRLATVEFELNRLKAVTREELQMAFQEATAKATLAAQKQEEPSCPTTASMTPSHKDNTGVEVLASAMKNKLRVCRVRGKGGWNDPNRCSVEWLLDLLRQEVQKGVLLDPVDVANYAMMIYNRGIAGA